MLQSYLISIHILSDIIHGFFVDPCPTEQARALAFLLAYHFATTHAVVD
jgi:hypothetical protein